MTEVNYKKPSKLMIAVGVGIVIILCFIINQKKITLDLDIETIAKIELRSGMNGDSIEITDEDVIIRITESINKMEFRRQGSTAGHGGWSYWLIWYDAEGNEILSFTTVGDKRIAMDDYFYKCVNGTLDKEYYKNLLQESIDLSVKTAVEVTEEEALEATSDVEGQVYTSMLDSQNGYVLRCSTPAASQMTKMLCRTSNGGTSFEKCLDVSSLRNYPCGIYFFTDDIGYIVTDYHGSDCFLYRTEDGGKTWSPQGIYIPCSWYSYVNGIMIEDDVLRIEVIADEDTFYYSYATDDMGETWKLINSGK